MPRGVESTEPVDKQRQTVAMVTEIILHKHQRDHAITSRRASHALCWTLVYLALSIWNDFIAPHE